MFNLSVYAQSGLNPHVKSGLTNKMEYDPDARDTGVGECRVPEPGVGAGLTLLGWVPNR